jgi:hypothetical protein
MQRATFCGRRGIECRRALAASAPGWRVVFDKPPLIPIGESFANLIRDVDAVAFGVLYDIAPNDLAHLDLTEGVLIGNYDRITISVRPLGENADAVDAHTLTSVRRDASLRPSERYMGLVIAGATEHALPVEYVAALHAIPTTSESLQAKVLRPMMDAVMRRR